MTAVTSPNQRFTVSHQDDFKKDGLRSYSSYRDLGIAAATNGAATAHVIRMIAPFSESFSQRHHHDVQFQLIYVLKGWFKSEFEGQEVQTMKLRKEYGKPSGTAIKTRTRFSTQF